jgi:uncharacterized protein YbjT (DUF2867 family)
MAGRRVLLTGATGFVGGAVRPALEAAGWQVRCLTRDVSAAQRARPEVDWIEGDIGDEDSLVRAMTGCAAAYYLVHGMADGNGFRTREVEGARAFARAATVAGLERVIYLGGIEPGPDGEPPSEHLQSRLEVGRTLRAGPVPTIELRASMIVGHGSQSWLIVRDLASRLPVVVLPAWFRSRTQPVAIDDVVIALVRALDLQIEGSVCHDLPGPETLSLRDILDESALVLGLSPPVKLPVPFLTPRVSSLWLRVVTRANWSVAREVVLGLKRDLLARDDDYWTLIGHNRRLSFAEAARRALAIEAAHVAAPAGPWGRLERMRRAYTSATATAAAGATRTRTRTTSRTSTTTMTG